MTANERSLVAFVLAGAVTLIAIAAYAFGVEDGARQAAPICVGEPNDGVRVHRPVAPRGRVP